MHTIAQQAVLDRASHPGASVLDRIAADQVRTLDETVIEQGNTIAALLAKIEQRDAVIASFESWAGLDDPAETF